MAIALIIANFSRGEIKLPKHLVPLIPRYARASTRIDSMINLPGHSGVRACTRAANDRRVQALSSRDFDGRRHKAERHCSARVVSYSHSAIVYFENYTVG